MEWMLWIPETTFAFIALGILLVIMTIGELWKPSVERRGSIIPMKTTRGDRLFIALLISSCLCALWIAIIPISAYWMILIAVLLVIVLLRWG